MAKSAPGLTAVVAVFLGLAVVGALTIVAAAFVPSVGTIRLMGLGTLLIAIDLLFVGLYCVLLAFIALWVKSPGQSEIHISALFAAAKVITNQMATVFLISGVLVLLADVYLLTHVVIKLDPDWHVKYQNSPNGDTSATTPDDKAPIPNPPAVNEEEAKKRYEERIQLEKEQAPSKTP